MPTNKDEPQFELVKTPFNVRTGSRRKTASATVEETGLTAFNMNGTEIMDGAAVRAALRLDEYGVEFGVDTKKKLVSVRPVKQGEHVMPSRRNDKGTISIHLGGVFDEVPALREPGVRTVKVWGWPTDEPTMLILSFKTATGKRTSSRAASTAKKQAKASAKSTPESEVAATDQ